MTFLTTFQKRAVVLLGLFVTLLGAPAFAFTEPFETVDLHINPFTLTPGSMTSIPVNHDWRYVQKVFVQAIGTNGQGTFEVVANGDTKGTIHVPAMDPSYVVTIGETLQDIQLRHINGSNVYVKSIVVVQSQRITDIDFPHGHLPFPSNNEASQLAREAIQVVDLLEPYTSYKEYGVYLLPIKKAGARAYAAAQATGQHRRAARPRVRAWGNHLDIRGQRRVVGLRQYARSSRRSRPQQSRRSADPDDCGEFNAGPG